LSEEEVNLAIYLTYLEGDLMVEWMENDKYN